MKNLLCILLLVMCDVVGQNLIEGTEVLKYGIENNDGKIEYIKIGKDTNQVKPCVIFLQGSLPIPLVLDFGDFKHTNVPFDYKKVVEEYHLIMISMPQTPLVVDKANLNQQYCYVPDANAPKTFSQDYLKANYLENYVERTQQVIADLAQKKWIDAQQISLIGHSQGAKIASIVASQNRAIQAVALLGFNAFGRYDEFIRKERLKLKFGQITGEEYVNNLEQLYEDWRNVQKHPNDFEQGHKEWTSFSIDYMPFLVEIEAPIFLGFGTEDIKAENGDLIPLTFIEQGKKNLIFKPYVGLDHNFFEVKEGKPDYENGANWDKVLMEVLDWMNENRN